MKREEIKNLLSDPRFVFCHPDESGDSFRLFRFVVRGNSYTIEWFPNTCILHFNEGFFYFDSAAIIDTWPNCFLLNLVFYDSNRKAIGLIPIEERQYATK